MIIFCEECGEMHIFEDESQLKDLKVLKCKKCNETIRVVPPRTETAEKV